MKIELRRVADSISSRHCLIQTKQQIWHEIINERIFKFQAVSNFTGQDASCQEIKSTKNTII